MQNSFLGCKSHFPNSNGSVVMYRLEQVEKEGISNLSRLPFCIRVILESLLRNFDNLTIKPDDIQNLAKWDLESDQPAEIAFSPARVLLQDFTGVPAVVDLAALRSAMNRLGGDPLKINPQIPVDLVIDHSVQVDQFGSKFALFYNNEREFERNQERYQLLRWGQSAFDNFRVVPPSTGIVHQVNLEYLAQVVQTKTIAEELTAFPDSLVGTDSHTTMINGLGVVGWGVGGIEAEAAMLGQPVYMLTPEVVGFKITGEFLPGVTATDLVLIITQLLRQKGVVGKFVEYFGTGLKNLSLADRATIANMAPEYGATMGFFPVDDNTLSYLKTTGRPQELVDLVERYTKEQHLFRYDDTSQPAYNDVISLDLSTVEPALAGPKRPQDRIPLAKMKKQFHRTLRESFHKEPPGNKSTLMKNGAVVIAAITSCTNTSNPSVMITAGLLAKNAVKKGISVPDYVKTSLAPGSKVVSRYLDNLNLTPYLEALGFHTVGYGCTTCIGNSGPLKEDISHKIRQDDLVVAAVLSGNRNFEGRVHPLTRINYLASPPLVIAYALAGTVNIDLASEPLGQDNHTNPVYLSDIWPGNEEIQAALASAITPDLFTATYQSVFEGDEQWKEIPLLESDLYQWDPNSTYIQEPPFFIDLPQNSLPPKSIENARVLVLLGDSVTTDHISPAGAIPIDSPAEAYLLEKGVPRNEFNSFGSRRGNHEVMIRGTFGNIRLKNQLVPEKQGNYTCHFPTGKIMSIYDASVKYKAENTPLIVLAGKEYGTGSSRDWAAKGTLLLNVKAVIAESFERIHRSNLVGMGILPLQFMPGENYATLGLSGKELFTINLNKENIQPGQEILVHTASHDGKIKEFNTKIRIDSPIEVKYYQNGGVLQTVLRDLIRQTT
jgi:aconitate hydratase